CGGGRYVAPLDPLSLRPALALAIFRQQTRGQSIPGQQGQGQRDRLKKCIQCIQQQQEQQRSEPAAACVGVDDGDVRQQPPRQQAETRSSRSGNVGAKKSLPIGLHSSSGRNAPPVPRRISPNDDPAGASPREGPPQNGPIGEGGTTALLGEPQRERTCCTHTRVRGSCGWARQVEVVLDAAGFVWQS
ncbi:unnamed protein product, partial [Ectocarpus fasciculatus]